MLMMTVRKEQKGLFRLLRLMVAGILLFLWPVMGQGVQPDISDRIKDAEMRIDSSLWKLENQDMLAEALEQYQVVATELENLETKAQSSDYFEQQRVLAYAYLRIGNILRQLGRSNEALQAGERELECARESGNDIALARALMNFGTTLLMGGQVEKGLTYIGQSRPIFEKGKSFNHKQGIGWYWILQAELGLAGLVEVKPNEVLNFLNTACEILKPIENWAGMARAYGLRARVHELQGHTEAAEADRNLQAEYEAKVDKEMVQ